MIVGVTGRYCAGKSTLVEALVARGYEEIDVDRLGHRALVTERDRIAGRFGSEILALDGSIDRRRLGAVVFSNPAARADLEALVHPVMAREVEHRVRSGGNQVINAAILHRMDLARLCDVVLCVGAPFAVRLFRAMRRDRLGLRATLRRLLAQGDVCPKRHAADVDTYYVSNCGSRRALSGKLDRILEKKGAL